MPCNISVSFEAAQRKVQLCSGMEKQTETKETVSSENIIIRVRGPWGVSRIRCHRIRLTS